MGRALAIGKEGEAVVAVGDNTDATADVGGGSPHTDTARGEEDEGEIS